jgi:uncharacterized protein YdcH (DUF465 family)
MKRQLVLVGIFFLLAGLVGCGSESGDAQVSQAIVVMNNARARLAAVKNEVNKAVDKAAGENNRELTGDDFKPAVTAAGGLKEAGSELQRVRERTEALKGSITPEERDELTKRFKSRWEQESIELQKTQDELDQAIKRAEDRGPKTAVDELKKTLRLGLGDFEVIARQP